MPQATASAVQATLQIIGHRLGCIKDLLLELDSLVPKFPNLSSVGLMSDGAVSLSFLDLQSETKFAVLLKGGE